MIQIWYHKKPCNDGLTAAAVAYLKYGENAIYVPVDYGEPIPKYEAGDVIYIVDFSYKYLEICAIAEAGCNIIVLDHHKTAQDELTRRNWLPGVFVHFDVEKSGAMLAWEYFEPKAGYTPLLIQLVQDRDLWQFKIPDSRAFSAGSSLIERTPEIWAKMIMNDSYTTDVITNGRIILEYQKQLIQDAVDRSWVITVIAGNHTYFVPCVGTSVLVSEIGEALLFKFSEALFSVTYRDSDKQRTYSLRSGRPLTASVDFDCSVVAKHFGGGGHKFACGFERRISHEI